MYLSRSPDNFWTQFVLIQELTRQRDRESTWQAITVNNLELINLKQL